MFEQIPPDVNQKKVLAGIMGIILGTFGVHKFILGYTTEGVTMLLIKHSGKSADLRSGGIRDGSFRVDGRRHLPFNAG